MPRGKAGRSQSVQRCGMCRAAVCLIVSRWYISCYTRLLRQLFEPLLNRRICGEDSRLWPYGRKQWSIGVVVCAI